MRDHTDCERGFFWSARAWYAKEVKCEDEIMFGMYDKGGNGGTTGEMSMKWIDISGKKSPQLQCFDDAWSALSLFKDVLDEMGNHDDEDLTQEQFIELLNSCGFKDFTNYDCPYK